MGVGPAGSLLGAVAVALVPMPVLFYYYGAKLREKSTFAPTSVHPLTCAFRIIVLTRRITDSLPLTKTAMTAKEVRRKMSWRRERPKVLRIVRRTRYDQSSGLVGLRC